MFTEYSFTEYSQLFVSEYSQIISFQFTMNIQTNMQNEYSFNIQLEYMCMILTQVLDISSKYLEVCSIFMATMFNFASKRIS